MYSPISPVTGSTSATGAASNQRRYNTTMHTLNIGKNITFSMDLSCSMERVASGGGYAQLLEVKI